MRVGSPTHNEPRRPDDNNKAADLCCDFLCCAQLIERALKGLRLGSALIQRCANCQSIAIRGDRRPLDQRPSVLIGLQLNGDRSRWLKGQAADRRKRLEHYLKLQRTKIAPPRKIIVPKNLDFTDPVYRKKLRLPLAKLGAFVHQYFVSLCWLTTDRGRTPDAALNAVCTVFLFF
jgi:hypothetical protein